MPRWCFVTKSVRNKVPLHQKQMVGVIGSTRWILEKTSYPEVPPRVEYNLTDFGQGTPPSLRPFFPQTR